MRIGSFFHSLFHPQNANFVDANANRLASFPARLDATARPDQVRELDNALAAICELPGGAMLMRALIAYTEASGERPDIVLTQDQGLPEVAHLSNGTWRVSPQALRAHPECGLQVLAQLYENMSQIRRGRFHNVAAEHLPRPGAALQEKWFAWMQAGTGREKRYEAIEATWKWVKETSYYGGLNYVQMLCMLDDIASNRPVPKHIYPELNLSGLSLNGLLEMPPGVYALRADYNELKTLEHLPDDLRMLRLNRALNLRDGPDLARQLQALPGELLELELDGNNLNIVFDGPFISRWALPKHLKLLSLRHNALEGLPVVQDELATLYASHNFLMNISPRSLEKATGLVEADFSYNAMPFVPGAIQLLPRSCRVNLSGNPLPDLVGDIAYQRREPVDIARSRLADELRGERWGPTIIYNTAPDESTPAPYGERARRSSTEDWDELSSASYWGEVELPSTADHARLENEVGHWVGADAMTKVAHLWRNIANKDGAGYFMRMLGMLRVNSANRIDPGFRASLAEYLTEFIRPERAALQEMTLSACEERSSRCVDHAALALVQAKMLLANDDVRQGAYDHRPKELVELAKQFFILGILTEEALAKGKALFQDRDADKQEYVETVLRCYVHFKEKLGLSLVVPKMNFEQNSELSIADLYAIEATIAKKLEDFPYFLMEWDGWHDMLKRNFPEGYASAQNQRFDDLDRLDLNITQALQRKELDSSDRELRIQEGVFVNRKMNYERMASVTRAYLESIGEQELALHVAPLQVSAMDEQIIIGPV